MNIGRIWQAKCGPLSALIGRENGTVSSRFNGHFTGQESLDVHSRHGSFKEKLLEPILGPTCFVNRSETPWTDGGPLHVAKSTIIFTDSMSNTEFQGRTLGRGHLAVETLCT